MTITCAFPSVQSLAYAIHQDAEITEGRPFSPRPYNRFDPLNSIWWLVPSTDWPAHRFGKAVLLPIGGSTSTVLAGLHVEKGYTSVVEPVLPDVRKRGWLLGKDWAWQSFVRDLGNGVLAQTAGSVGQALGAPVTMLVVVTLPPDYTGFDLASRFDATGLDPETRPSWHAGEVWFEVEEDALHKINQRWLSQEALPIARYTQLAELPQVLAHPKLEWLWVDVYLGVRVTSPHDSQLAGNPMPQRELWVKAFQPWMPWIK